jgi:hypothetical protein
MEGMVQTNWSEHMVIKQDIHVRICSQFLVYYTIDVYEPFTLYTVLAMNLKINI